MSNIGIVEKGKTALKNAVSKSKLPWTPRAYAVLEQSQKQAREDGCALVGTEHILFGIVSVEDCLGATILKNLGADQVKCSELYEKLSRSSGGKRTGRARLSEDTDKVIQCAQEQAAEWDHEYIGAEHLLAGILRAGKGLGFQILADLGITLDKVCEETERLIVCRNVKNERREK